MEATATPGSQAGTGAFGWPGDGGFVDPNGTPVFTGALPTGKPPVAWIAGAASAAGLALIGGLVAAFVLGGSLTVAAMSWLLPARWRSSCSASLSNATNASEPGRSMRAVGRPATIAVGVMALLAVVASAYVIANWVATR